MPRKPGDPYKVERNEKTAEKIRDYARAGITQKHASALLKMSEDSIQKHYGDDWDIGKAEAIYKLGSSVYKRGLRGDNAAAFFYLKTQGGWRETDRLELTGQDGKPIEVTHRGKLMDSIINMIVTGDASTLPAPTKLIAEKTVDKDVAEE